MDDRLGELSAIELEDCSNCEDVIFVPELESNFVCSRKRCQSRFRQDSSVVDGHEPCSISWTSYSAAKYQHKTRDK